jgi:hypothetical protein
MMVTIGIVLVFALIILGIRFGLNSGDSTPKTFRSQEENLNIIRQWVTYFGVISIISLVSTVIYLFYLFSK